MKCGIAAPPPCPPWDCEIFCASAAACPPGTPFEVSEVVILDRNTDAAIVPRIAKPRLAAKFRTVWVMPVASP